MKNTKRKFPVYILVSIILSTLFILGGVYFKLSSSIDYQFSQAEQYDGQVVLEVCKDSFLSTTNTYYVIRVKGLDKTPSLNIADRSHEIYSPYLLTKAFNPYKVKDSIPVKWIDLDGNKLISEVDGNTAILKGSAGGFSSIFDSIFSVLVGIIFTFIIVSFNIVLIIWHYKGASLIEKFTK